MALIRAFVWTQWATNAEGAHVPAITDAYPHELDAANPTKEAELGQVWVEIGGVVQQATRVSVSLPVLNEGVRRVSDATGTQDIPPTPNILMAEVVAEASVLVDIDADFDAAPDKTGTHRIVWATALDPETGPADTGREPDEPFTDAEITALSAWINAHGVTNTQFANYFGVTAAEVAEWMRTHPRQQFTTIVAREWAKLQG